MFENLPMPIWNVIFRIAKVVYFPVAGDLSKYGTLRHRVGFWLWSNL